MPRMKYFQEIADIREHLDNTLRYTKDEDEIFLEDWGVKKEDLPLIQEEIDAMSYLLGCQLEVAYDYDLHKPSKKVLVRCFKRRLDYVKGLYIKYPKSLPKKIYDKRRAACEYYLEKLEYAAWYDKLPEVILTFSNKYSIL